MLKGDDGILLGQLTDLIFGQTLQLILKDFLAVRIEVYSDEKSHMLVVYSYCVHLFSPAMQT